MEVKVRKEKGTKKIREVKSSHRLESKSPHSRRQENRKLREIDTKERK